MKKQSFENYKLDLVDNKKFNCIGEFEFIKDPRKNKTQLGLGSFGEVKLALHKKSGIKFAIKIMNLKNMNSFQEIQGIEREVRVHSLLKHPNIIEYHDSFQQNEFVYIILDYASNGNLYSHLYKKRSFCEREAYKYFSQTCEAIKYLHAINIVHRDLKPENILLDEDYNIKVCDFGWCTEDIENPRNTFCGTYEYMAPEIVFRQPYDYRIDIWALGVLIYELLHGSAPFKGKTFKEIQRKIEKGDVQFSDQISDISKQLICKVLQANPIKRISIEDIMNHPWMQKMKQSEREDKKTDLTKLSNNTLKVNNNTKVEENEVPKTKELIQVQKKSENRSLSPIFNGNQKKLFDNKSQEKENTQIYQSMNSISNTDLTDRKKTNTPNKTNIPIVKNTSEFISVNSKKCISNQKISQTNQKNENPQTSQIDCITQTHCNPSKDGIAYKNQTSVQTNNIMQQTSQNISEKINENNAVEKLLSQQSIEFIKKQSNIEQYQKIQQNSKDSVSDSINYDNPFKKLDQNDLASLNNIAKKQQEMMKAINNKQNVQLIQQVSQTNQDQHQSAILKSKQLIQQLQKEQHDIKNVNNFKNTNNYHVNTETAYCKDIDECSITNSQKTINTSRYINKHSSVHGNFLPIQQTSVSQSLTSLPNNLIVSKNNSISLGFGNLQNFMLNSDAENKLNNDININQKQNKIQNSISNVVNSFQVNKTQITNNNTSLNQDEPCFSLFGCLGTTQQAATQRNKEAFSSTQPIQTKLAIPDSNSLLQMFSQTGSTNSIQSSFVQNLENRPRVGSTNQICNNSFLNKENTLNVSINTNTYLQYSTTGQNIKEQVGTLDKNVFSTSRSYNSLNCNKSPSISNHSFLVQSNNQLQPNNSLQPNSKIISNTQLNHSQQNLQLMQQLREKQPLSDKTNVPVSAIPTKQINLLDERKHLQKLQQSLNKDVSQHCKIQSNNNSFTSNVVPKERSLTQDCILLQQYGKVGQIQNVSTVNQLFNQSKAQPLNSNNNSFSTQILDRSLVGQSYQDISHSNRGAQRSRTLIFEEHNTERTKNAIESMDQMISFVRNALPFSDQNQNMIINQNTQPQNIFSNSLSGRELQNQNNIKSQVNISFLQNTSLQRINSIDQTHTPNNISIGQKQQQNSKSILSLNNIKTQSQDSQNNIESQKLSLSQQQLSKNNIKVFTNIEQSGQMRNKQQVIDNKVPTAQTVYNNQILVQSIPNLNNINSINSINNFFTHRTPTNVQSLMNFSSLSQQGKHQF